MLPHHLPLQLDPEFVRHVLMLFTNHLQTLVKRIAKAARD